MFRFTIRDVLWLMVVVAMAVAWWKDHQQLLSRTKQNIELMACESLLGQSRDQIVELFGRPEGTQGDRWVYFAGTGKEVDVLRLEVVFYNNIVVRAAHRTFRREPPPPLPVSPPAGPPPSPPPTNASSSEIKIL